MKPLEQSIQGNKSLTVKTTTIPINASTWYKRSTTCSRSGELPASLPAFEKIFVSRSRKYTNDCSVCSVYGTENGTKEMETRCRNMTRRQRGSLRNLECGRTSIDGEVAPLSPILPCISRVGSPVSGRSLILNLSTLKKNETPFARELFALA